MGLVYGKVIVSEETFGYQILKDYCASNEIGLACDFPEDNLIATTTTGMDATGFEISLEAIPYPFYGRSSRIIESHMTRCLRAKTVLCKIWVGD